MNIFGKRALAVATSAMLVMGGLGACAPAEPKTASELVERVQKAANRDNFHMNLALDMKLAMLGQEVPLNLTCDYDIAGEAVHGTLSIDAMGNKASSEMYAEKNDKQYDIYQKSDSDSTWSKMSSDSLIVNTDFNKAEDLAGAEFAKTDNGYTLTVSGDTLINSLGSMGNLTNSLNSAGVDSGVIEDMFKNANAVYTYDKNFYLTNLDFTANGEVKVQEDLGVSANIDYKITGVFSNYGGVDAASVAVPEDVKSGATDLGNIDTVPGDILSTSTEVELQDAA